MNDLLSPLRYPGSKHVLADYFEQTLRDNLLDGCTFHEPYAGGASMSLALLGRGVIKRAVLVERDPLLYAFWRCVIEQPERFCEGVQRVNVNIRTWLRFQVYLSPDALRRFSTLELGLAGLFFNRTNFSGIIGAKPIGGMGQQSRYDINCRFNKDRLIKLILKIAEHRKRITVRFGDAVKYLARNQTKIIADGGLVYVDPPYYQQGKKLYRYHYQTNQHKDLAEFMDYQRYSWIVSIDNHPLIQNFYRNQTIIPIFLNYAVRQNRRAEELLISNIPLTPPVYEDQHGNLIEIASEIIRNAV